MNNKQALELIKQLIDQSIKRGVFENAESVLAVSNAFNVIAKELIKDDTES
jgi:hypothetical protein